MISSRQSQVTRAPRYVGRWLAIVLVTSVLSGALGACDRNTREDTRPSAAIGTATSDASGPEPTGRDAITSEAARALDLARFITDSLVAQQGTCLVTEREPGRSRLVYSMLPTEGSYLRLTVVTSPDGTRPVMVDLARGLPAGHILYATLAPHRERVRLETFRSASDRQPLVTDMPLDSPAAQDLLTLGERALVLRCQRA
jgi:hypothetical protein